MSMFRTHLGVGLLLTLAWARTSWAQPAPPTPAAPPAPAPASEPSEAGAAPSPQPEPEPAAGAERTSEPLSEPTPTPEPEPEPKAEPGPEPEPEALLESLTDHEEPLSAGGLEASPIDIYGFADFTYRHSLLSEDSPWNAFIPRHASMYVGNINLYFDKQIAQDWRSLLEARLTYLPHGARQIGFGGDPITRENNRESDYTVFQRDRNIGGLILEQIWLDYTPDPRLTVRVGQWLSPYGIWVTDHGSPAIIGVSPPFIVGSELIPERQVGVQLKGGALLTGPLEYSYALGFSNGRTDVTAFEDLDDNKAITARFALHLSALGQFDLGSSAYYGRHTESVEVIQVAGNELSAEEQVSLQLDELVYAFDARWVLGGLHAQSEWMVYERKYTDVGRPPAAQGGLAPDRRKWGGYGLVGYRLPWFPLMPYAKVEYAPDNTAEALGIPDRIAIFTGGLNYRPLADVVLKGEYTHAYLTESGDALGLNDAAIDFFDLQIAWAF